VNQTSTTASESIATTDRALTGSATTLVAAPLDTRGDTVMLKRMSALVHHVSTVQDALM